MENLEQSAIMSEQDKKSILALSHHCLGDTITKLDGLASMMSTYLKAMAENNTFTNSDEILKREILGIEMTFKEVILGGMDELISIQTSLKNIIQGAK